MLEEKYKYKRAEAKAFADFLLPMLAWDPEKRATAEQMLKHPWLTRESNYDEKVPKDAPQPKFEDDQSDAKEEMGKLILSDNEQNQADNELSTFSSSDDQFFDGSDFSSDLDDLMTVISESAASTVKIKNLTRERKVKRK